MWYPFIRLDTNAKICVFLQLSNFRSSTQIPPYGDEGSMVMQTEQCFKI
jgi:hypothetical protein